MSSNTPEPTRALPLHGGTYVDRYLLGLVLIISGTLCLQGANPWVLQLLLLGTVIHTIGWAILPARGWRRVAVIVPAMVPMWLLLTGPQSVWVLSITLACWLLVRHRPLISYVALALPIANGMLLPYFFEEYRGMPAALAISAVVLVGAAWLARLIAHSAARRRTNTAQPSTSEATER